MDEHLPFDVEKFSGQLPLFPLPNVVLLPGGLLSLHVFEPRYREMVKAVLEGERFIGMAVLKPGFEVEYDGTPPIFKRVCLGEVTRDHELPDGRWLITLRGMRRVDVTAEDRSKAYRVATVSVVRDLPGTLEIELRRLRQLIAQTALRTPESKLANSTELKRLLGASESVVGMSLYVDLVAAITALNLEERRAILEGATVCERGHDLLRALVRLVTERQEEARRWPVLGPSLC